MQVSQSVPTELVRGGVVGVVARFARLEVAATAVDGAEATKDGVGVIYLFVDTC